VTGCSKVSQGCKNCYAETIANRFWGERKFTDVICHDDRLEIPLHWRKPRRVFVNSMSDLFHEAVPDRFIAGVFNVMASATLECNRRHRHEDECWTGDQHTFQVLTKRPGRMRDFLERGIYAVTEGWSGDSPLSLAFEVAWPLPNVWLGVSVEDQATADQRVPLLVQTPAAVRWVSVEPMLGPVDFEEVYPDTSCSLEGGWPSEDDISLDKNDIARACHNLRHGTSRIDWIVCGCESGPKARPLELDWVRQLRDQCVAANVPFFLKQLMVNGKLVSTPELDGRSWMQYPEVSE
jgi:protein gp37